jgi:hypothetical protein
MAMSVTVPPCHEAARESGICRHGSGIREVGFLGFLQSSDGRARASGPRPGQARVLKARPSQAQG